MTPGTADFPGIEPNRQSGHYDVMLPKEHVAMRTVLLSALAVLFVTSPASAQRGQLDSVSAVSSSQSWWMVEESRETERSKAARAGGKECLFHREERRTYCKTRAEWVAYAANRFAAAR